MNKVYYMFLLFGVFASQANVIVTFKNESSIDVTFKCNAPEKPGASYDSVITQVVNASAPQISKTCTNTDSITITGQGFQCATTKKGFNNDKLPSLSEGSITLTLETNDIASGEPNLKTGEKTLKCC